MITAEFHFIGDLNYFLSRENRGSEIHLSFGEHQSIKHLIESLGVPHVEVGEILSAGTPVKGSDHLNNGDRIEVRPVAPGCPVQPRFLLDNHLGRLAAFLRMLGFDCLYKNDYEDSEMAELLAVDPRILLSRDRRLLMRKVIRYGYCLRSLEPLEQLAEVVRHYDLAGQIKPFCRCLRCNSLLEPVSKEVILDRLQPLTKKFYNEFVTCRACDQIYWKGSHYEHMQVVIECLSEKSETG